MRHMAVPAYAVASGIGWVESVLLGYSAEW